MQSGPGIPSTVLLFTLAGLGCDPRQAGTFPPEDPLVRADNEMDGDPHLGRFPMEEALAGLGESGEVRARLKTSAGEINCRLLVSSAPLTVANFVGLARGLRPFQDEGGEWVTAPFYDGLEWHRAISGQFVQTGRRGSFERPGFRIQDERSVGNAFDKAGILAMANDGTPHSAGTQFFVTSEALRDLDGGYTIFGRCQEAWVVRELERQVLDRQRPTLDAVVITRD
jgi:peptidyl-prolyl cis-trans isomerase A (cyclophilin A)